MLRAARLSASTLFRRDPGLLPRLLTGRVSAAPCLQRAPLRRSAGNRTQLLASAHSREVSSTMAEAAASRIVNGVTYLCAKDAAEVDVELMGALGFSVDQLMELAGLSVSCSVAEVFPVDGHRRVLVICGPGNNGGDGLVAARHLTHFGYSVSVCYPKPTDKPLYNGLVTQCQSLGLNFVPAADVADAQDLKSSYDVVVDAMFGFSFKGAPRPPFDGILAALAPGRSPPPVASVDIPSGWQVDVADAQPGLRPDLLVSLTAPKLCSLAFAGHHHFLGGRFVPPAIRERFNLQLPAFPATHQCVRIGGHAELNIADMRVDYRGGALDESDAAGDPYAQFNQWMQDAVDAGVPEANAVALGTADGEGRPSVRMVLLKGVEADRGFVFYTNYDSRKGGELAANPRAALCFFWEPLQRSVRIEGDVEQLPPAESDAYFHSRPVGSQIGAWVSRQSTVLQGRGELEARERELKEKYGDGPVDRPPHWGGYLVRPRAVEFWAGRQSRLHDRLRYKAQDGKWTIERLSP
ncbi:unnamed protein product [Pedinophyceae sp. YPF-701]|nr:unnamed protein product [Pedinophyceae sp. YPF-701]